MVKTYEIDFDDALVDSASKIFEDLGTDIDTAIRIFLTQAVLRKGFPFSVVIPDEEAENKEQKGGIEEEAPADKGVSAPDDEEESTDSTGEPVLEVEDMTQETETEAESLVTPEIAARVAANEALVAEMRNEIGDKSVTPEFDENEDDGTRGNYEAAPASEEVQAQSEREEPPAESANASAEISAESSSEPESVSAPEKAVPQTDDAPADEEDEDETTPDNLFDAWDVGEEEDIGCNG